MKKTALPPRKVGRPKGKPQAMDIHVGNRIRMQRQLLGWSQEKLADAAGITFQQVQKYERGANRVSASRLYEFSQIMGVGTDYFFDQYNPKQKPQKFDYGFANECQTEHLQTGKWYDKETLELIRIYYTIPDRKLRRNMVAMIQTAAAMSAPSAKRKAAA